MGMNCVFRDRAGVWPLRAFDIVALWLPCCAAQMWRPPSGTAPCSGDGI